MAGLPLCCSHHSTAAANTAAFATFLRPPLKAIFDENDYDEGWILKIIDAFLDRKYDKNGENGGLFPLHFCNRDAREMEIWDQMNEYLVENWV